MARHSKSALGLHNGIVLGVSLEPNLSVRHANRKQDVVLRPTGRHDGVTSLVDHGINQSQGAWRSKEKVGAEGATSQQST